MKGKLVKKLKSIKPIGYLKLDRVLQVNAADGFIETLTKSPSFSAETQYIPKEPVREKVEETRVLKQEPDIIDVAELMRDLEEDEMEVDDDTGDKENIGPPIGVKDKMETSFRQQTPLLEINISSFRRPDLNSGTLFDPNLLAAFEQAVKEHFSFEEKCPPGDSDSVILYTTTLRGIRKTFEECNSIRFLLESFRVIFCERDVSMHMEFKEELWRVLEGKVKPPRLFIRGRYIGGAEEVLRLHEQGKFRVLLKEFQ
ncbi:hypothetical protein GH714_001474 [Hevea brasiliensis]|uniref:Glutaredoxin domain-containing protein n=1 Tax=Hevea brasiliensis TaxID=3981 RepID=A0A6A6N0F1_HEVBR|nr:hypothetical protein GH714_001474 [Hevea brasiliensis]